MPSRRHLTAAVAVALCAFSVTAAGEIQLTPPGPEFRGLDGRPTEVPAWKIDATIAARLIARLAARQTPLSIDYEHQSLNAQENGMPAPAAGWFKGGGVVWREGAGLFGTGVEWTERAKQMIVANEYRYISPVFAYNAKTGEVVDILMASLTNVPNLDGMAEVALRAAARFQIAEEQQMNPFLKAVLAALGLPETTTEADASAAVVALKLKADKVSGLETELAAAKQKVTVDPGKFVSVETHNAVVTEIAALKNKLEAQELSDVIDIAMSEGRLPAAEEDWARKFAKDHGIVALKTSLEKRAPIAALARQQTKDRRPPEQQGELSEAQLAICRNLGVSAEDYKKQLAAQAAA